MSHEFQDEYRKIILPKEVIVPEARLPKDLHEQLLHLPCEEERGEIVGELALNLFSLLSNNGVIIIDETCRPKTNEGIGEKIVRRGRNAPLRDLYGVRFVTNDPDRARIAKIIQDAFPLTPAVFPDGMPSVREYADPKTRSFVISHFNPRISERHSAMHVNIVFLREDSTLLDIAEVQILTEEEMRVFRQTRGEYKNGKH